MTITGSAIATTFWGKSWCRNLECYSDFSNRLPRGRTYARNGSLVDLLSGSLSDDVMRRLARPGDGMFPAPREVKVKCSCPDGARLCKHLAAVLYAIGNRLDTRPELLFLLRDVDQTELVAAATKESVSRAVRGDTAHALADDHLAAIFGIEIGGPDAPPASRARPRAKKPVGPTPKGKAQPAKAKPAAKGKLTAKPKPTAKSRLTAKLESTAKRKPAKRKPKPQPAKRSARTPRTR